MWDSQPIHRLPPKDIGLSKKKDELQYRKNIKDA